MNTIRVQLRTRSTLTEKLRRLVNVFRAVAGNYFITNCLKCGTEFYGFQKPGCRLLIEVEGSPRMMAGCPRCKNNEGSQV